MQIQACGQTKGEVFQDSGDHSLDALINKAADPATALEVLLVKDGRLLRRMAQGRVERQRVLRQKELGKALAKTRAATGWRLGQRLLTLAIDIAGKACQAAGCDSSMVEIVKAVDAAAQPLGTVAETCQQDAEAGRIRSQVHSDEAGDATQWLASIREVEQRMLSRLEGLEQAKHESQMRAAGFGT
mgnify:CR=1 FL=1